PNSDVNSSRNITLFTVATFTSGIIMFKSRQLAVKQHEKLPGDYTVTVDRSG
ncbi:hypothetical protein P154DRAFT_393655, partial [Amniculicola lignicola CBS 123094]